MPKSQSASEAELLSQAQRGNADAFGDLYEKYLEPVYRYVFYRVGDEDEAEDLTEVVFLKAWEALPTIKLEEFNFRAWIYRIAHNLVIDRHRMRRPNVSLDENLERTDLSEHPEVLYQQLESRDLLHTLISRLDGDLQQVVLFRFIMGMSHAETAQIMHRTEVHVRVMQHRALKEIRALMQNINQNG